MNSSKMGGAGGAGIQVGLFSAEGHDVKWAKGVPGCLSPSGFYHRLRDDENSGVARDIFYIFF